MLFKARRDFFNYFYRLFIMCIGLVAIYIAFVIYLDETRTFAAQLLWALGFFIVGLLIWKLISPLFRCKYSINEGRILIIYANEEIIIQCKRVLSLEYAKRLFAKGTLSTKCLKIEYIEDDIRKTIYVSPKKEEEFIKQLKINCHSMKIVK